MSNYPGNGSNALGRLGTELYNSVLPTGKHRVAGLNAENPDYALHHFFGGRSDVGWDKVTGELPNDYLGQNNPLNVFIRNAIARRDLWPTMYALPYRDVGEVNEVGWDVMEFNPHRLRSVPYQGVPRLVTSFRRTEHRFLHRQGVGIFIENMFNQTAAGRRHFFEQVEQVANAARVSFNWSALSIIIQQPAHGADPAKRRSGSYAEVCDNLRRWCENMFILQKMEKAPLQHLYVNLKDVAEQRQLGDAKLMIIPRHAAKYINRTDPYIVDPTFGGKPSNMLKPNVTLGGDNVRIEKSVLFKLGKHDNHDPYTRTVVFGGFSVLPATHIVDVPPDDFKPQMETGYIYCETPDADRPINKWHALGMSGIGHPGDRINIQFMAMYCDRTFADYLKGIYTNQRGIATYGAKTRDHSFYKAIRRHIVHKLVPIETRRRVFTNRGGDASSAGMILNVTRWANLIYSGDENYRSGELAAAGVDPEEGSFQAQVQASRGKQRARKKPKRRRRMTAKEKEAAAMAQWARTQNNKTFKMGVDGISVRTRDGAHGRAVRGGGGGDGGDDDDDGGDDDDDEVPRESGDGGGGSGVGDTKSGDGGVRDNEKTHESSSSREHKSRDGSGASDSLPDVSIASSAGGVRDNEKTHESSSSRKHKSRGSGGGGEDVKTKHFTKAEYKVFLDRAIREANDAVGTARKVAKQLDDTFKKFAFSSLRDKTSTTRNRHDINARVQAAYMDAKLAQTSMKSMKNATDHMRRLLDGTSSTEQLRKAMYAVRKALNYIKVTRNSAQYYAHAGNEMIKTLSAKGKKKSDAKGSKSRGFQSGGAAMRDGSARVFARWAGGSSVDTQPTINNDGTLRWDTPSARIDSYSGTIEHVASRYVDRVLNAIYMDKDGAMDRWNQWSQEHGIPCIFSVLLFRPRKQYITGSATLMVPGASTGNTLVGEGNTTISKVGPTKVGMASYTVRSRAVVYKPNNIINLHAVMSFGYRGGHDAVFADFRTPDHKQFHKKPKEIRGKVDIYAVPCPWWMDHSVHRFMDLTGEEADSLRFGRRWEDRVRDGVGMVGVVGKQWGFNIAVDPTRSDKRVRYNNTLCFRDYTRLYDPSTKQHDMEIQNTGPWGPHVFPGVGRVRSGMSDSIESEMRKRMLAKKRIML